jgi:hypothetical protein
MGIFDDPVEEAYEDGQDSGAHGGPVQQAIDSQANAVFSVLGDRGDEVIEAFEAGQQNGRDNPPED